MSDRGPYIQTFSGGRAYLLDPRPEDINLLDIAHGLSNICRFGGHTSEHYSVASHSVLVSTLCEKDNALVGLMHDATEAYVGDVVSPLKGVLTGYREIEAKWAAAIDAAFGFRGRLVDLPPDVKKADMIALAAESHQMLTGGPHRWDDLDLPKDLRDKSVEVKVVAEVPLWSNRHFLERFAELWRVGAR